MVKIAGTFDFPYQFLIHYDADYNTPDDKKAINICQAWCIENCKSMWMITDKATARLYAPVTHVSLIVDETFEPSEVVSYQVILLSFQAEDEAMAFKLSFEGGTK